MANLLTNLIVDRVSFVDRAAVRDPENPDEPQRFLFWKSERGKPWQYQPPHRPKAPPAQVVKAEPTDDLTDRYRREFAALPATKEVSMTVPPHAVRAAAEALRKAERDHPGRRGLAEALATEAFFGAMSAAQREAFDEASRQAADLGQGTVAEVLAKAETMVRGTPVETAPTPAVVEKFDPLAPLGRDLFGNALDLETVMQDDEEWLARERGYAQSAAEAQAELRQHLAKRELERAAVREMVVKAAEVKAKPAQDITGKYRQGGAHNTDVVARAATIAAYKAGRVDLAESADLAELLAWFLSTPAGRGWFDGAVQKGELVELEEA